MSFHFFYIFLEEEFVNQVLFTHRYFTTSEKLIEGLLERYKRHLSVSEETNQASHLKLRELLQEKLNNFVSTWIENHFYFFDNNVALISTFKAFLQQVIEDKALVQKYHLLLEIGENIRANYDNKSAKTSFAIEELILKTFNEAGLIKDRRKNFRTHKQCFLAMEGVNLMVRKLKMKEKEKILGVFQFLL